MTFYTSKACELRNMVRTRTSVLEDALEGDAELSLSAVLDYMGCDDWLVEIFMVSSGTSTSSSVRVRVEIKISHSHSSLLLNLSSPLSLLPNRKWLLYLFYLSCPALPCTVLYLPSVLISLFYWFLLPTCFSPSPYFFHSHFVDICSLSSSPVPHLALSSLSLQYTHASCILSLTLHNIHTLLAFPLFSFPYHILSYPSPLPSPPLLPSLPPYPLPLTLCPPTPHTLSLSSLPTTTPTPTRSVPPGHGIREWLPA